jgi:hypothetical protein
MWEQVAFDEMIMMSSLYYTNMLSWIFIVLAPWNNIRVVDMLLHSDTLSRWDDNDVLFILDQHA